MFERNIIIKVLIGMIVLLFIGLAVQSYRVGNINKRYTALQVSTATLEASRDKLKGMYESANTKLAEARLEGSKAKEQYRNAIREDEASSTWADTALPTGVYDALR